MSVICGDRDGRARTRLQGLVPPKWFDSRKKNCVLLGSHRYFLSSSIMQCGVRIVPTYRNAFALTAGLSQIASLVDTRLNI